MKRGALGYCCSKCGISICDHYGDRIIELEKEAAKLKAQLDAYIKIDQHACCKQRDALLTVGDQMYRAIVYTSGVDLNYAADEWKKVRDRRRNP